MNRLITSAKTTLHFCKTVLDYFNEKNCLVWSGALAFTTLLAIVPIMVVSLYIFSMFPVFDHVGDRIQAFIIANFVPTSGQMISDYLNQFTESAKRLPDVGLAWLVVMVIFLIRTIEHVFNYIWHVTKRRHRLWVWLRYWIVLTLTPIMLGASVAFSAYLDSIHFLNGAWQDLESHTLWADYLPVTLASLFFIMLYRVTPNTFVPMRCALVSGVLAALLLKWAKALFTWSLLKFPTYQMIYGTVSILPLFLLWIQLSWMIILFGAVLCRACAYSPKTK